MNGKHYYIGRDFGRSELKCLECRSVEDYCTPEEAWAGFIAQTEQEIADMEKGIVEKRKQLEEAREKSSRSPAGGGCVTEGGGLRSAN